jgi:hypothetical protein
VTIEKQDDGQYPTPDKSVQDRNFIQLDAPPGGAVISARSRGRAAKRQIETFIENSDVYETFKCSCFKISCFLSGFSA